MPTQTMKIEIGKNVTVRCGHLPSIAVGKVVAITSEPGKTIGVEFDLPEYKGGFHSCDGRGVKGKCLWVSVDDILSELDVQRLATKPVEEVYKEHEGLVITKDAVTGKKTIELT